jgi:hypothetical protein
LTVGRTRDIKQAGFDNLAAGQVERRRPWAGGPEGEARSAE